MQAQQKVQEKYSQTFFFPHMWTYSFDIDGQKARKNEKDIGYLPMAQRKCIKQNGISTFTVKAKTKNGLVRLGVVNDKCLGMNSWTRTNFIFFDGNTGEQNKHSSISYDIKQVSENLELVKPGQKILKIEINMSSKQLTWSTEDKVLTKVKIPQNLQGVPLHVFFSLKNPGDTCQFI